VEPVLDARGEIDPAFERRLFDRAVALWNARRFHEAHEDWETLWNEAQGPKRLWLQGLIQFAAAFHHFERTGSASGFAKLMRSASEKCGSYGGDTLGLDFARLWAALEPWRAHGERVAAGAGLREGAPAAPPSLAPLPGCVPDPFPFEPDEEDEADEGIPSGG
jgi:hypothetical protein